MRSTAMILAAITLVSCTAPIEHFSVSSESPVRVVASAIGDLTPAQKTEARAKMATAPAKIRRDNVDLLRWLQGKDPGTPAVYRIQVMTQYVAVIVADDDTGTNERPGFLKRMRSRKVLVNAAIETNRLSFDIDFYDVEDLKAGR